jgi:hypothetical protein
MKASSIVSSLTKLIDLYGDCDVVFGFFDEGAFDAFDICDITVDESEGRFIIA